ncbi:MAG: CAP domain-containing protein [Candidatus Saccharimonadales bacterium]
MKQSSNHPYLSRILFILLGIVVITIGIIRFDITTVQSFASNKVLSYATLISRSELLSEANVSRSSNNLLPLSLNSQLNTSAQAKAQHMADNNYWAHVAPDGTQPWYFFEAAGYSYQAAGENLAYGFDSSFAVNQGWMNSSGHRANILGDYSDVGFGIVNAPSFQGGEYTIVVAHYGKPLNYTAPAPPPAPSPAPQPAPTPAPAPSMNTSPASGSSQQASESESTPAPSAEQALQPTASPSSPTIATPAAPKSVKVAEAKNVSVLDMFAMGTLPGVAVVSLALTLTAALGYAITHRTLMQHALITSERFVIAHPTFDVIALTLALALILTTTAARLQ